MHTPCKDCPFRTDIDFYLPRDRRQNIADTVIMGDAGFPCHKTVNYRRNERVDTHEESPCIGALKMIENVRGDASASLYGRLAHMVGKVDLNKISDEVPVYESVEDFVNS